MALKIEFDLIRIAEKLTQSMLQQLNYKTKNKKLNACSTTVLIQNF